VTRGVIAAIALCLLPAAASAQPSAGPMVVEQIHNGFLAAPDFKITDIDGKTSGLAGGYAGVVIDEHFFIGGGAYFLATDTRGRDMAYGGLVLQWMGGGDKFGYAGKMLIGGGSAGSSGSVETIDRGRVVSSPYHIHDGFAVFEPELDGLVHINDHLRLTGGIGYRFAGSGYWYNPYDYYGHNRLSGVTGTIGLHISFGG
jgi:hypothetical protein